MATKQDVKVLGWSASPFVARVRIALNLKGIEYEFLNEDLGRKSDLLLKSNPVYKKVPVLIHGEKPVCESLLIVQYIDEVWAASGLPILPADAYDRAVARFWAAYIDDKLPNQAPVLLGEADEPTKAEATQHMFAALQQLEEVFEKCSEGKSFFGGNTIGYVDITLGSYLGWMKAMEKIAGIKLLDEEKIPQLVKWAERFCSSDAVKEVIPQVDQFVEFSKVLQAAFKAAASPSN
ncbi:hypothetical protein M5K25_016630 [Dendrobium thyrsiflorum]|uniref:glutathione transferase n=1 Tax=Dendrobium thyrsiflorum TaxID=117978 RepID=A0ABD0UKA4_DENTH